MEEKRKATSEECKTTKKEKENINARKLDLSSRHEEKGDREHGMKINMQERTEVE